MNKKIEGAADASKAREARAAREAREMGEAEAAAIELVEMTTKFSGVLFRKAELDKNFEKVYTRFVEKMVEFELVGNSENILEIFGETGG